MVRMYEVGLSQFGGTPQRRRQAEGVAPRSVIYLEKPFQDARQLRYVGGRNVTIPKSKEEGRSKR
jgi:hypothetical protein